jgi:hypothetical protein
MRVWLAAPTAITSARSHEEAYVKWEANMLPIPAAWLLSARTAVKTRITGQTRRLAFCFDLVRPSSFRLKQPSKARMIPQRRQIELCMNRRDVAHAPRSAWSNSSRAFSVSPSCAEICARASVAAPRL